MYEWAKQLPKPNDGKEYKVCSKCSGNGKYVMGIVNGNPWSATGTTCYKCEGRGWIEQLPSVKRQRKIKCQRCGGRYHFVNGEIEKHTIVFQRNGDFVQEECHA